VILLNAGTIALLVYLIVLILLSSGWREVFISSLSYRSCLLFMILFPIAALFTIPIHSTLTLNMGVMVLLVTAVYCLDKLDPWYRKIYVITVTLLIGVVYALFGHFVILDPIFIWVSSRWDPVIVSVACVLLAVQTIEEQLIIITVGFLFGDAIMQGMTGGAGITLGTAAWYDQWWISILTARLCAWSLESVMLLGKNTAGFFYDRLKSWKK